MLIKAPLYQQSDIIRIAGEFLAEHHPSASIPVPIEFIIESRFGIDIVPVPNLKNSLDVDSFITSDLSSIYVDSFVQEQRENRYRFSLAHELGHRVLHQEVFSQMGFSSIQQWKEARAGIAEREYRFIEWHANEFAGRVLVPPLQLSSAFETVRKYVSDQGFALDDSAPPAAWDWLVDEIAKQFAVSGAVIGRRGPADGLWDT